MIIGASQRSRLIGILSLFSLIFVAGCTHPTGDFGRPRLNVMHDDILPAMGRASTSRYGATQSSLPLTVDEQALRNVGWTIVQPMNPKNRLAAQKAQFKGAGLRASAGVRENDQQYARYLSSRAFGTPASQANRLADDISTDEELSVTFYAIARRVNAADRQRSQPTADIVVITRELSLRHEDNRRLISRVDAAVQHRLRAYQFALREVGYAGQSPDWARASRNLVKFEATYRRVGRDN
jgi:hypothetical protein